MEIWFFSLFALSRKRTLHVLTTVTSKNMTWQSKRSVGIGFLKLSARLTLHQRRVSVAIFDYPMKHKLLIMYNPPVSSHRPEFSRVSAYGNNSCKRTAPLTDTFFNSRGCPLTRELTVVGTALDIYAFQWLWVSVSVASVFFSCQAEGHAFWHSNLAVTPIAVTRGQIPNVQPLKWLHVFTLYINTTLFAYFQVTLDVPLQPSLQYSEDEPTWHIIRDSTFIYGLRISPDSDAGAFFTVVQNTIRSLQGTWWNNFDTTHDLIGYLTVVDESILNPDVCISSPAFVFHPELFYKRNI